MKRFIFTYEYTTVETDRYECEAETLEEAQELFDKNVQDEDAEIVSYEEREPIPYIDPNQLDLPLGEK